MAVASESMADFIAEFNKVSGALTEAGIKDSAKNAILNSYKKNEDGTYSVDLSGLTPD